MVPTNTIHRIIKDHTPIRIIVSMTGLLFLSGLTSAAIAQEGVLRPDVAPPPSLDKDVTPEPEVTIRREGDDTLEEYRINGRLYMIKVTPSVGPAYYLVDKTGDGSMDARINGPLADDFIVPQWVLFSW